MYPELSEDEINYLGNLLDKKSAADICYALKKWFIDNELYMYEDK